MIEAGLVTTETPLQDDMPEFGNDRDDVVRPRHFPSHISGITEPAMVAAEGLKAGLLGSRDFAAGSASRYSTVAFEGIARMIQKRTGCTWNEAVADALSSVDASGLTLDEASNPHFVDDAEEAGLDLQRFTALQHPGAGLIGRAEDLLNIGAALLRNTGEIVKPSTLALMRRLLTGDIRRLESRLCSSRIAKIARPWSWMSSITRWSLESRHHVSEHSLTSGIRVTCSETLADPGMRATSGSFYCVQMDGGTTFNFATDGFEAANALARESAGGAGVGIAGATSIVRQAFLAVPLTS